MSVSVVVLAAGFGTRMKSTTSKVMQPLCGAKMIDFVIQSATSISDDINVVLHHQKDQIKDYLSTHYQNLNYTTQDMQNHKGTGGALHNLRYAHDEVIILNGDMPLLRENTLKELASRSEDVVLSAFVCERENSYGRVLTTQNTDAASTNCTANTDTTKSAANASATATAQTSASNKNDAQNIKVLGIVETKDATPAQRQITLCNAGVYKIKSCVLDKLIPQLSSNNAQNEYYLTDIIALAIDAGYSVGMVLGDESEYFGVNSKIDLEKAESMLQERIKDHWLAQGVIMHNKSSIYISQQTKFIGECEIYPNTSFYGRCLVAESTILDGSVLEDSKVFSSQIGPHARLRPKCDIDSSRIGNFVECKNAKLQGVKAGHLSYLGDCDIEQGVNIGCGVVICNYDGKQKHHTHIGQNAFIGSNTNLIAPINIPADTLIAAGSTLGAKQANALSSKALFYQRAEHKIIDGFKDF